MNASDELKQIEAEEEERAQRELAASAGVARMPPEPQMKAESVMEKIESPWGPRKTTGEKDRLRALAGDVAGIGWLLMGLAVVGGVFGGIVVANSSGAQAMAVVYIAGGVFGLGLWVHLIAQLIHIRAALEKDP